MKKLNRKSVSPPPFKKTCPCTIIPPPSFNFSDPPSRGGNQNLLLPHLKKGGGEGGGCLNYVILKWKHILSTKDHTSQFIPSSVLVVNNITNVEWNKLQNWCDALIEVTMYSKVWKRNYYFSIVFKLSNRYKQLLAMLDLLMYQSSDTCILIRFTSHFWAKINK